MRTLLVLTALTLTALPAAAEAVTLFEDPAGDVGPWPTLIVGAGAPGPADADLLGATLEGAAASLSEQGADAADAASSATLTLSVASLPDPAPSDRIWSAGWSLDDGRHFAVGYLTTRGQASAGACVWEKMGDQGPEGEPECVDIPATVASGSPGAFAFTVPEEFLAGGKTSPGGAVLLTPEGVAEPLGVLHWTGFTVVDFAWGDDVAAPADDTPLEAASIDTAEPRPVPAGGLAAILLATVAVAATVRRLKA